METSPRVASFWSSLKLPVLLAALGLAYQAGYWSQFSINVFGFAEPADLVALAIAPVFNGILVLVPKLAVPAFIVTVALGAFVALSLWRDPRFLHEKSPQLWVRFALYVAGPAVAAGAMLFVASSSIELERYEGLGLGTLAVVAVLLMLGMVMNYWIHVFRALPKHTTARVTKFFGDIERIDLLVFAIILVAILGAWGRIEAGVLRDDADTGFQYAHKNLCLAPDSVGPLPSAVTEYYELMLGSSMQEYSPPELFRKLNQSESLLGYVGSIGGKYFFLRGSPQRLYVVSEKDVTRLALATCASLYRGVEQRRDLLNQTKKYLETHNADALITRPGSLDSK